MDKRTPKGGAGTHNWGSLINERDLEDAALYDQDEREEAQAEGESPFSLRVPPQSKYCCLLISILCGSQTWKEPLQFCL